MTETGFALLTLVMTLPLGGVLLLAVIPGAETRIIKWVTLFFTALTFVASLFLFARFDVGGCLCHHCHECHNHLMSLLTHQRKKHVIH